MIMIIDNGEDHSKHEIRFIDIENLNLNDCLALVKMFRGLSGKDSVIGFVENVRWYKEEIPRLINVYPYSFYKCVLFDRLIMGTARYLLTNWIRQARDEIAHLEMRQGLAMGNPYNTFEASDASIQWQISIRKQVLAELQASMIRHVGTSINE